MAGAVTDIAERTGLLKLPLATAFARARGLPRSTWGAALAHFALGITLLGIVGESQWSSERIAELKPGQSVALRGYDCALMGATSAKDRIIVSLSRISSFAIAARSSAPWSLPSAIFPRAEVRTAETALMTRGFSQIYLSLGETKPDGALTVRLYYKPLVLLIWLGPIVMATGGALSFRIGGCASVHPSRPAARSRSRRQSDAHRRYLFLLLILIPALAQPQAALSVQPDEMLADRALEQRARTLSGKRAASASSAGNSIDRSFGRAARP